MYGCMTGWLPNCRTWLFQFIFFYVFCSLLFLFDFIYIYICYIVCAVELCLNAASMTVRLGSFKYSKKETGQSVNSETAALELSTAHMPSIYNKM